jgi:type I restriction-modification system DNA methylase subunit
MNRTQARAFVTQTFTHAFDKTRFRNFILNVLNHLDESKAQQWNSTYVKDAFKGHVNRYERLGTYTSPEDEKLDVLVVWLTTESKLERARTAIRNFVADHLKTRDEKDAALVAFVSPSETTWRFSYVKMEYATVANEAGKVGVETRLTPARRFSYIVGEGESCHTAQTRFLDLLSDTDGDPLLANIEDAFSVEAVTKEFFTKYAELFGEINAALEKIVAKDKTIRDEFAAKGVNMVDFAKKLMGQIVFLYFLQKKGWLGVAKGHEWGTGPHDFLRRLAKGEYGKYENFFNDILEPLFYDTLATDRGHEAWCNRFKCRIPFLNGGLFEPLLGDYNWRKTDIILPNKLFTNSELIEEGITGSGVLDVFDRYNFTVNEAEPLEKEVAIDPEMLGKVFENLIEENRRKGLGAYYTPREIVHYMCQESLINYLDTALNKGGPLVPRAEIETFVHLGEQISHYEAVEAKYAIKMPKGIQQNARSLDEKLADITICDPAVGSGAFPVGMMTEVVRCRCALTPYFNDVHERTPYHFKRHAIQNCLYGVDIDASAVEIAKLRLWLSLVVDEEETKQIKPLPNLLYKVVTGDSLLRVEKTLFNEKLFHELEALKPEFFDESDTAKKAVLRRKIDNLIHQLTNAKEIFDFEIYFSEVFHANGGFDIVIANPPYGGHIDSQRSLFSKLYPHTTKQFRDIYKVFIELGLSRLCTKGGILSYITPNTLIRQPRYTDARQFLIKFMIMELVNLGEEVFEQVVVPTCFFFVKKESPTSGHLVMLKDVSENSKFTGQLLQTSSKHVPQKQFSDTPDNALAEEHERLGNSQAFLEDVLEFRDAGINYQRVNVGMEEKGKSDLGQRLLYEGSRECAGDVEFWKGEDIDKCFIAPETGRFVRVKTTSKLRSNERVILNRAFFEFTPKLIWRQTAPHLIVTVDERGIWFGRSIQAGVIKPSKRYLDYKFLCAVLNSRYMQYKYDRLVREAGRVFPQVKWAKIRRLAIPDVPQNKQQPIIKLAEGIFAAKCRNRYSDTAALEHEIDRLVYELYGLTPGEIRLVEDGTARRDDKLTSAAKAST